jgi:hypothetical protein
MSENNAASETNNDESNTDVVDNRPRWEVLYEKYADSLKNPSNTYLNSAD